ncbi:MULTISPECIES: ABC transporter ATP-binding protein [unclassified Arcicella]|uniref:ABC transporter ATP-binding protein n=1 Tax=unclassified Arcicella TaxID=2644986 RepID=UPI00285F78D0|nr:MULTISPECIES: ABC transporter ATP-binding protein [unclassified Arcicella]MDR6559960.1 ATP-binding cassette subfamily B protein [Arcicella sp. BE51]MDR6810433.1 ATP-binding cassette subfamily B protein [Arcicella sp. BE140]MDR6821783.1 ATP-binding cassette subfamily B protein [Arcicella sp. BE139]
MRKEEKSGQIFDIQVLKRIYSFLSPYRLRFWSLVLIIMVAACVVPLNPLLIRHTIDNYIVAGNYPMLTNMLLLMVGVLLLQGFLQFVSAYMAGWLGQTVIRDIRVELYEKILSLRLKFFDDTPIGRLVTRTVSDIETLNDVFSEGLAAIAGDILQLILITGVMFWTDWRLTLICLCTVPFMVVSTYLFKEYIKKSFNEVRLAVANLNSFVHEHITGMNIVQIFNSEKIEYNKFHAINEVHRDAHIRSIWAYSVYFPVADVILAAGTGLIVWFGSKQILTHDMTLGTLTAFIMFMNLFFRPIRFLADRFNTLQMGIVSTERIIKLLESDEYVVNNGTYKADQLKGNVRFENVWFAYNDEEYVLKDISFEVKQGETIALVGATGAGKSSTINLLSRFYEINKGKIWVDDIDLQNYELNSLRSKIGVVLQDVFLFSDTIENNITLGDKSITREKIIEAAKLVGAHEFIDRLPDGYDYNVMERGATLSVGQRQLISFVRALVHDPKIIVLDEATSSVDTETEEMIQNAIAKLMKGRTAIVIAHRLSTIQNAHKILVLDKGEIKEEGTHEALLEKDGWYASLHKMQFITENA